MVLPETIRGRASRPLGPPRSGTVGGIGVSVNMIGLRANEKGKDNVCKEMKLGSLTSCVGV